MALEYQIKIENARRLFCPFQKSRCLANECGVWVKSFDIEGDIKIDKDIKDALQLSIQDWKLS